MVLGWFEREEDRDTMHTFESDLLEFWDQHSDEATEVHMLIRLYEKGPCSFRRNRAVRRLIELNALPEGVRVECWFDSNGDIRALVGEKADERLSLRLRQFEPETECAIELSDLRARKVADPFADSRALDGGDFIDHYF